MVLRLGLHYFRDEKIKVPVTRRSTVVSSGGGNPDRFKAHVRARRRPEEARCHSNIWQSCTGQPHTPWKNRNFST